MESIVLTFFAIARKVSLWNIDKPDKKSPELFCHSETLTKIAIAKNLSIIKYGV